MGNHSPVDLKNKTVIIVDDGIATGYTITATIQMLRKKSPAKIILAIPVCPPETAGKISKLVDEFICLTLPDDFGGVGQFYLDFTPVSDEEVVDYLQKAKVVSSKW
jgi:predicted phosphoribosyltransferase